MNHPNATVSSPPLCEQVWYVKVPPSCLTGNWKLDTPTVNNKLTRNIPHYLRNNLGDKIKSAEDGLPKKAAGLPCTVFHEV